MAQWIERLPRSREVTVSRPGRAKPKAVRSVLVVSSLDAQHLEDTTRTGWPGVRIMWLGDVLVSCVGALYTRTLSHFMQQATTERMKCDSVPLYLTSFTNRTHIGNRIRLLLVCLYEDGNLSSLAHLHSRLLKSATKNVNTDIYICVCCL